MQRNIFLFGPLLSSSNCLCLSLSFTFLCFVLSCNKPSYRFSSVQASFFLAWNCSFCTSGKLFYQSVRRASFVCLSIYCVSGVYISCHLPTEVVAGCIFCWFTLYTNLVLAIFVFFLDLRLLKAEINIDSLRSSNY